MPSDILQPAFVIAILVLTIRICTPILFAALGELVVEHAGVLNLGIEGSMLMGAFVGFLGAYKTGSLWFGVGAAALAGAVMGLGMAFMATTLKVNQAVAGVSLNLLATGLSFYWYRLSVRSVLTDTLPTTEIFDFVSIPHLSKIPYIGEILFSHQLLTYAAYLMVPVIWFFLYKTKRGLELRCCGENPRAVDMRGLSVARIQYAAVVFGGMMAGIGGAYLTVASSGLFLNGISGGRGWLALVVVIAGNWKPARVLLVALVFGLFDAFQTQMQAVGVQFPYQLLLALPYILALVALVSSSRLRVQAPLSLGVPYSREE
jgi:simple sugar transport system permease protein